MSFFELSRSKVLIKTTSRKIETLGNRDFLDSRDHRLKIQGRMHLIFLPKSMRGGGGVKTFRKNCRGGGGPLILGFIAFLLRSFWKFHPPPCVHLWSICCFLNCRDRKSWSRPLREKLRPPSLNFAVPAMWESSMTSWLTIANVAIWFGSWTWRRADS